MTDPKNDSGPKNDKAKKFLLSSNAVAILTQHKGIKNHQGWMANNCNLRMDEDDTEELLEAVSCASD